MDDYPPDPEFQTFSVCPGRNGQDCRKAMGPVRVYLAKGAQSNPANRGRLVQTCTDFTCLKTIYLTPAYKHEDALRLVLRKAYPGHPDGLPRTLRPPSPSPPPTGTQNSQIFCSNELCITKQGTRTRGNGACIDRRCKSCCVKAGADIRSRRGSRNACITHAQAEIIGTAPPLPPPPPFAFPPSHAPAFSPPTTHSSLPSQAGDTGTNRNSTIALDHRLPSPAPTQRSTITQPIGLPTPSAPSSTQTIASPAPSAPPLTQIVNFPTPSAPGGHVKSRSRTLAKPLGGAWATQHRNAEQEKDTLKNMKIQQHEMDERKKRTCLLVFYHTREQPPVRIDHYIPTFPNFQLSAYPELVRDLELPSNARLDIWEGEWITVDLSSVRVIEKGQRIILKLRHSFRQGLDDRDCPGIEEELANQPQHRRLSKRPGESFVSPLKKVPRHNDARSVHSSSQAPHPTLPPSSQAPNPTLPPSFLCEPALLPQKAYLPTPLTQSITTCTPKAEPCSEKMPVDKMWPHDFYVCTVASGLAKIEKMMGRNRLKAQSTKPQYTLKSAFHKAFPNTRWAKTTFCKYRKLWNKADEDVQRRFIDLGESSKAVFKSFITALDDPRHIPSSSEDDGSDSETESNCETPVGPIVTRSAGKTQDCHTTSTSDPILPATPVESFRQRLEDVREILEEILLDPLQSEFFNTACASFAGSSKHPAQNPTHAEYYGPDGYTSIVAALRAMFLEHKFDLTKLSPLTWDSVIRDFIYPEAVTLLISNELGLSLEEAVALFRSSRHSIIKREAVEPCSVTNRPSDIIDLTFSPVKVEPREIALNYVSRKAKGKQRAEEPSDVIDLTISD